MARNLVTKCNRCGMTLESTLTVLNDNADDLFLYVNPCLCKERSQGDGRQLSVRVDSLPPGHSGPPPNHDLWRPGFVWLYLEGVQFTCQVTSDAQYTAVLDTLSALSEALHQPDTDKG